MVQVSDTQVLPAPQRDDTDHGDRLFHYVLKERITESAVTGTFVVALCGETFPVTRTAKPGSPVCPECRRIVDGLPSGGEG
ncbi:MAG: DUF3039 domain-containing protein [Actinobacteria bacterium]|nr:DUF3039 domain-containing protein [Actinomycetota bacterium]